MTDTYTMIVHEKAVYGFTDDEQLVLNLGIFSILNRINDGSLSYEKANPLMQSLRAVAQNMIKTNEVSE